MPKARRVNPKKGAKSIGIRTKFKLGGRQSTKSAQSLKDDELLAMLAKPPRNRDRNMLERLVAKRGLKPVVSDGNV